ncbi:DNA-processing protein DprA [Gemmatimonas sp. UBA7669]|uniref:DNA-processing protein DprA n=1 Tax=Gemmatimonas sp. UBA7669 TaxID=1946568 RepID=UPI0025BAAF59|nr:DNA-processing protein DprA [Gemmatimonas sp. UBA7669]
MRSFFPEKQGAAPVEPAEHSGQRAVHRGDRDYPSGLEELRDPPKTLWVRGSWLAAAAPAVAIVGTRHASPYGLRVAKAIAECCARHGVSVISGLARGIDGAAHEAALAAGGRTAAVLGTAIDHYYPRGHRPLQERIAREGLLVSEHAPGDPGHAGSFPRRNRIIAALAAATVVVEAPEDSGALITAEVAQALGRRVYVVPNAIDVPQARGSNAWLHKQGTALLRPEDVLAELQIDLLPPQGPVLSDDAALCWDAIGQGLQEPSLIAQHTGLAPRRVAALLAMLEIDGLVTVEAGGQVRPAVGV